MSKQKIGSKAIQPYPSHGSRSEVQNEESTEKVTLPWWIEKPEPEPPKREPTAEARRIQLEGFRLEAQGQRFANSAERKSDNPELAEADAEAIRRLSAGW
jgi:hypothetical protein